MSPKDVSTVNYFCKSCFWWDRLTMNWVDHTCIQPTVLFSSSMLYHTDNKTLSSWLKLSWFLFQFSSFFKCILVTLEYS